MKRIHLCLWGSLLFMGCATAPMNAAQTLTGMDQATVLISAQHALALEGYDVDSLDVGAGTFITSWKTKNKRQVQYKVTALPTTDKGIEGVDIKVFATTREKTVSGWSSPQPSHSAELTDIIEHIVALAVDRYSENGAIIAPAPAPAPAPPPLPIVPDTDTGISDTGTSDTGTGGISDTSAANEAREGDTL